MFGGSAEECASVKLIIVELCLFSKKQVSKQSVRPTGVPYSPSKTLYLIYHTKEQIIEKRTLTVTRIHGDHSNSAAAGSHLRGSI